MTVLNPAAVPLVGRHTELQWLQSTVQDVLTTASGQLVTVIGPRGVGKTRVAGAFAEWCGGERMVVLPAQCIGRSAEPLLPIREALRQALGSTTQAVRGALRRSAPDLLDGLPLIGRFLSGLGRELSAGPQVGGDNPRGLYDVLSSLVVKLSSKHGLVLLIEDAHVADPDTLSFVTYLLNKSRDCPVLIVLTVPAEESANPAIADYLSEWEEKGAETYPVGPLESVHVAEYLRAVLGPAAVDAATVDFMVSFTGGNPLLLCESIRHIATADGGVGRLAEGSAEIPERIRRLLERRLTRLDERTRAFTDVAAVIGHTSHELTPILGLLGVDDTSGLVTLDRACSFGILAEGDDGRILFTSELLHMVAYAQLRANQRRALHLSAGDWFERQQEYSQAAHHYERAEDWRRMVPVALLAAQAAEHVGLYRAALGWYRRIQPHTDPAELFPRLAKAMLVVGDWADAERLLNALPSSDPATLMLRSTLSIVVPGTQCGQPVPVPQQAMTGADAVYVGWFGDYGPQLPEFLRGCGALVVSAVPPAGAADRPDGGGDWYADIVVGSESEYPAEWLAAPYKALCHRVGGQLKWVVVTQGERGATAYGPQGPVHIPPLETVVADATGAGDSFTAGLLHGLLSGADMATAGRLGAHWAATALPLAQSVPPRWDRLGLGDAHGDWAARLPADGGRTP